MKTITSFKIKTENVQKRWFKFTKILKDYYFNLPILTAAEYEQYREELLVDDDTHLIDLVNKSVYRIVDAVAQVYANHKIENIIPVEEAAALVIEYIVDILPNINYLPPLLSEYLHSTLSLLVYRKLDALFKKEIFRLSKIDILDNEEMNELIALKDYKEIDNVSIYREDFKEDLSKVLKQLAPRQRDVFCLKYGITTGKEMSYQEISAILGISRASAHDTMLGAEKKLKNSKEFEAFKEYNDLNMGQ